MAVGAFVLVAVGISLWQYLVGTPRRQMKRFEAELLKENWTQVRPDVEVKQVAIPQGNETYILCRTTGRKEKERLDNPEFYFREAGGVRTWASHSGAQWRTIVRVGLTWLSWQNPA